MTTAARPRVLVLGGGFGGLESAYYLRWRLGDRVDLTLVSDRDHFLYKPNTIYIPFGLAPEKLHIDLVRPTRKRGIDFVRGRVEEIDPVKKTVRVDGSERGYDYLIVATGAAMRPSEIAGLEEHALTIWTEEDMLRLREAYARLVDDVNRGGRRRVLFLVPPNNKCSGPLYEMVMMLDTWLRRKRVREGVDIGWATFERGYIQAFGPRLNEVVEREFQRRGIHGHRQYIVTEVSPGKVAFENGEELPFDLLVSFPPYIAANRYEALPSDDRGFVKTELGTRQVAGHPDVYAVGDTGDFPVKQAFLAFLQADAASEHLAQRIAGPNGFRPFEPTSMCVMEMLDSATFAQVPLRVTGRPEQPVEVRPDALDRYKVGVSPAWRVGKKLLGLYLPFRFANGNPFHAGLPWKGMEVGLKVMSALLAK